MRKKAIVFFTRVPDPGITKTRLYPFLSHEQCCMLQKMFILDIYSELKKTGLDIIICHTLSDNTQSLLEMIEDTPAYCFPQEGESLGDRMYNAINNAFFAGYQSVALVGSDVPLLSGQDVWDAFEILENKDIVVSPTKDGGYYLIGMNKPFNDLFAMTYSNNTVFENTIAKINSIGASYGIGKVQPDIDDRQDLITLWDVIRENPSPSCKNTAKYLHELYRTIGGK